MPTIATLAYITALVLAAMLGFSLGRNVEPSRMPFWYKVMLFAWCVGIVIVAIPGNKVTRIDVVFWLVYPFIFWLASRLGIRNQPVTTP